jgi:MftR C-terminal domain
MSPAEAVVQILDGELNRMMSWLAMQEDPAQATVAIQRFGTLMRNTPALRAHQRDMTHQLVAAAAETIAERAGLSPDDPEPQIAATALIGLWDFEFRALRKYLDGSRTPAQAHAAITAEVHRAAQLLDAGLRSSLGVERPRSGGRRTRSLSHGSR